MKSGNVTGSRVLILMSGSIAAYKVCHVISRLVQAGHDVEVVASPWALKFVGEATIEGLTGKPVRKAMFGSGAHMSHINLIRWADLAIVCPATANTINKLAQGLGDDLITTSFLAHDFTKPFLIAPAMNTKMYHHPVTQASVERLRGMGCEILETASGVLACGEIGDGKLLDSELLLNEILRRLPVAGTPRPTTEPTESVSATRKPGRVRRVLITSGGTSEPIDPVRSITNHSTGSTGAQIASVLLGHGYHVHFLSAKGSVQPHDDSLEAGDALKLRSFQTYKELASALEDELRTNEFSAVIHAAAVSDYSVAGGAAKTKNDSAEDMTVKLIKNPKLLDSIRGWSKNPEIKVVAFKLTATADLEDRAARLEKLMKTSHPDFVVTNDRSELPAWQIHKKGAGLVSQGSEREELGFALEGVL
ncbi:bifunctional phosphopantothenoylcysteine decarboxylase/phosphopantothenate--cysteine ligase CoaBC [soil metagenome]